MQSAAQTGERAIAGVTSGIIKLGETVTWQGRHFGLLLRHETKITKYERPRYFQDVMLSGAFRSFEHDHFFEGENETLVRDVLRFSLPFGPIGVMAERLVIRGYLRRFLIERNTVIRRTAEAPRDGWQRFVLER